MMILFIITLILQSAIVTSLSTKPHVAVIGAGWAGWGAAKTLCESNVKVTLIDLQSDPSGKETLTTQTNKPYDIGVKGFWYDYPNIVQLLKDINVREQDIFTNYLNSSFYSPYGLEATAPVFSDSPQLPSPLGQIIATFQLFERLPVIDRITMVGLLYSVLDMYRDENTFASYDRMTAHELFIRMGISKRLVDDFLRPTLLIGLFKAPEELSAAVAMELLYFYALAHQNSFDVRWIKSGTIAGSIFAPLSDYLTEKYDLSVLNSTKVNGLNISKSGNSHSVTGIKYSTMKSDWLQKSNKKKTKSKNTNASNSNSIINSDIADLDGVVLALGAKGLRAVLDGSPELATLSPQLSMAASLGSIDCISCRLWFDRKIPTRTPANVFSRFRQLRGAGGTFFMLDQLQKESLDVLWGEGADTPGSGGRGSVVAVDFYNAGGLMTVSDEALVKIITQELLPSCVKEFSNSRVVDSHVQRCAGAVTWFSPGSYYKRPRTITPEVENLCSAGDWVVMNTDDGNDNDTMNFLNGEHGAKGLCQERAYVSGLLAANKIIDNMSKSGKLPKKKKANIIPVRDDELQVKLGRNINRSALRLLNRFGVNTPWLR